MTVLNFINKEKLTKRKFQWQEGYGAFTNSHSQIDAVAKYILNQKAHHAVKSFKDEYDTILKNYAVPYNENYTFKELED